MRIGVRIMPRKDVLDSQGRAVERSISQMGMKISSCVVGKYIILDFQSMNQTQAMLEAKKIAEDILHNPLVESFELEAI
jgi:phosphoribosylformylglycinamidine (FGAM) synthase PurS component